MVRREKDREEKRKRERERPILSSFSFSHPQIRRNDEKLFIVKRAFRSSLYHGSVSRRQGKRRFLIVGQFFTKLLQ